MTREEAKEILGEDATDEQITTLMDKYHKVDESHKKQVKAAEDKANQLEKQITKYSDYETIKKQLDDINKTKMSKEEQLAEKEKQIDENLKASKCTLNKSLIREKLSGLNLNSEQLDALVETMASEDQDSSLKRADLYVETFNQMKETTIKATKDDLINVDVKPNVEGAISKNTFDFEAFTKMTPEEQAKFALEHPDELDRL